MGNMDEIWLHVEAAAFYKLQDRNDKVNESLSIAQSIIESSGDSTETDFTFTYTAAAVAAIEDRPDEAIDLLEIYVESDPAFPPDLILHETALADLPGTPRFDAFIESRRIFIEELREEAYAYERAQEASTTN